MNLQNNWRQLSEMDSSPVPARKETLSTCLIQSPCLELRDDRLELPLGMLYIATLLRSHGYPSEICDLSGFEEPDLHLRIPDGADVYGFSTYSVNYSDTCDLMRAVRTRNPDALCVAGGPHATALPQSVLADGFDVVVTGEAEVTMLNLVNALAEGDRPKGIMAGVAPNPLDELPIPDRELVDLSTYSRQVGGEACVSILSSRGCPYRCTFCNSNIMGAGSPIRFRSPQNVADEIRHIKETYGIRHFRFQDDIFTINQRRVKEMTPCLGELDIVYRCFARLNTCANHADVPKMLADSGCTHASFGVESGSPEILSIAGMHKSQTPEQIRKGLTNAHRAGITTRIFLIVGFPGETDETVRETIELAKSCPWDEFSVYPLIAYPGTPLHDNPSEFGITYIDTNYSDYLQIGKNFKAGFTIRTDEFDEVKVREWRDRVMDALLVDGRTWAGDSKSFK